MTMQDITNYLDQKAEKNEKEIIITFYEIRVKANLTEEETDEFLRLCRTRLENQGYDVYFTGARYTFEGNKKIVQQKELMVAIKES